jgi:hypothetical protein
MVRPDVKPWSGALDPIAPRGVPQPVRNGVGHGDRQEAARADEKRKHGKRTKVRPPVTSRKHSAHHRHNTEDDHSRASLPYRRIYAVPAFPIS